MQEGQAAETERSESCFRSADGAPHSRVESSTPIVHALKNQTLHSASLAELWDGQAFHRSMVSMRRRNSEARKAFIQCICNVFLWGCVCRLDGQYTALGAKFEALLLRVGSEPHLEPFS